MQTDIIADPDAVVVEFMSASIAFDAVFGVFEHVSVTHFTVEFKVKLVEHDNHLAGSLLHSFQRLSMHSVELNSWVRGIAGCDYYCL